MRAVIILQCSSVRLLCTTLALLRDPFLFLADTCVTEWRRFLLALLRSDLVKQIFNDQTSKVQLIIEFITDILYIHDVSSL